LLHLTGYRPWRGKSDQECKPTLIVFTASPVFTLEPLQIGVANGALRTPLGISVILKMKPLGTPAALHLTVYNTDTRIAIPGASKRFDAATS
jgi:hypothetical protein